MRNNKDLWPLWSKAFDNGSEIALESLSTNAYAVCVCCNVQQRYLYTAINEEQADEHKILCCDDTIENGVADTERNILNNKTYYVDINCYE